MLRQSRNECHNLVLLYECTETVKISSKLRAPDCLNALRRESKQVADRNPNGRIADIERHIALHFSCSR